MSLRVLTTVEFNIIVPRLFIPSDHVPEGIAYHVEQLKEGN
jgi:hypothetical protein